MEAEGQSEAASLKAAGPPVRSPTITIALIAYNNERYIREAVEAALAQVCEPLEIILSDDASSDRTFEIIRDTAAGYEGPHSVILNRNARNIGLAAHVNRVFEMASGDIVMLAAGDDISLPSRAADTIAAFARHPEVVMVSFVDDIIDDAGSVVLDRGGSSREVVFNLADFAAAGPFAQRRLQISGASRAILRSVFESFGNLIPDCPAEDTPFILRSLYVGSGLVCHWAGIKYRQHDRQLSTEGSIARMDPARFTNQYLADLAVALHCDMLDEKRAREVRGWVDECSLAFELRRVEFEAGRPSAAVLRDAFRSTHLTAREKLGVLKRFVVRRPQMASLRRCRAHLVDLVARPGDYLSRIVRGRKSTDVERWSSASSFDSSWDSRTHQIARFIHSGDRIAEFGAGMQALRDALPPGCIYQPFDLVARTRDTRVSDLNQGFPEDVDRYNVAVFSGVLEYLHDLRATFHWLGANFEKVIFSYAVADRVASPLLRNQHGWVNNLYCSELIHLARAQGFTCRVVGTWRDHLVFLAERS